jgi:hypothetical protein
MGKLGAVIRSVRSVRNLATIFPSSKYGSEERTRLRGVTRSNGTDHFWMGQQTETGFEETNGDVLEADFGAE